MAVTDCFDKKILNKYNTTGPRYTSYPTAVAFHDQFNERAFSEAVVHVKQIIQNPTLSLYLHIPFCHSLCYYCGCNKIVTRNQDKVEKYLSYLKKEIKLKAVQFDSFRVNNIHFGGGTPSFLTATQFDDLLTFIANEFHLDTQREQSIEIDPREIELDYIDELKALGFNRISIGVQDVDLSVQEKINRVQSTEFIHQLIKRARDLKFNSVNIDLIYGLPNQTIETLEKSLYEVEKMAPDRISLFSYAHMPNLFPAQRKIKEEWMPSSEDKFELFRYSIKKLCDIGYEFIGMDHFAKKSDELSKAANNKTLQRNFQGYTTDQADALLGLGVSSISNLHVAYSQNVKKLGEYYNALDGDIPLIEKGVSLSRDDVIHRAVINQLMCNLYVDKRAFEEQFGIVFNDYFSSAIAHLAPFVEDNLVTNNSECIKIHPRGRLLIRNISMSFDQYIGQQAHQLRYSRVI